MKKIIVLLFGLCFISSNLFAASQITFEWDANTEPDLAGYRLYQSNSSGSYTFGSGNEALGILATPANIDTAQLSVAVDGTYYWVLTAYDTSGNESGPSNEVTASLDSSSPGSPSQLQITIIIKLP